ncbi:hypothetical protein ACR78L_19750 [Sphingobacterium multivorum]|uniref:hypothetical protein n=1 Tax=Sphingobacterium multivorum TaxID=28454 RepID=UPI003DA45345
MTFLCQYFRLYWVLAAFLFSFHVSAQKQSGVDSNALAIHFVDGQLPEGNYTAAVLGIPRPNASQLAIVEKMKQALKANEDWFFKTMKELKPGEPILLRRDGADWVLRYRDAFRSYQKRLPGRYAS